jgi:hypothetical protein
MLQNALQVSKYSMSRHDGAPGNRGENQSGARVDPASRPRVLGVGSVLRAQPGESWGEVPSHGMSIHNSYLPEIFYLYRFYFVTALFGRSRRMEVGGMGAQRKVGFAAHVGAAASVPSALKYQIEQHVRVSQNYLPFIDHLSK